MDIYKILTIKKLFNFIEIETSRILSLILRRPIVWGVPYIISVEPTSLCNLKCPECPTGSGILKRENAILDMNMYQKFIDGIKTNALHLLLYFQGEPLMNGDIFGMIKYATERRLYTIISSNGQFLDNKTAMRIIESGLDRIIISVDGTDQSTYEKYRAGGNLNRILEGTKYLNALKKEKRRLRPEIIFQFLVFRHNENQVNIFRDFGKRSGADRTWIKSAQVINPDRLLEIIPENPDYSRYTADPEKRIKIKAGIRNHCSRLWRTCVVTTDGDIVPCCFDKEAKYIMGSLKNAELSQIWNNEKYMEFRRKILTNRRGTDICNNCSEGLKVYLRE